MDALSLNPRFLQELILKTRAVMAQTSELSNEDSDTVDEVASARYLGDDRNLSVDEVISEIEDLEPDQQAELVALMWIGRGDMEPEEWDEAVQLAMQRRSGSTAEYLLTHPHLAEHWDEGVDKIFDGSDLVETGEY
ncbi:MAG: DUF3775 domain-containing protein [Rhodobacteraceae bacterium]|uniref:DUF3775 domain-containing protein n=1 Tax=Amaricoccus sp. B4 TaxID=3368557 RepID=UPI000DACEEE4|nr:DUF3775 domain-containing protein [Paracoccaceae bacterium]